MKRSARYTKALKQYEESLTAEQMLLAQHGQVISTFRNIQEQIAEAEKELKDSSKEEAIKDPKFRAVDSELFSMSLTESRTVNDDGLLDAVGQETYDRLATVKKYVTLSSLEKAAELGVVPEDVLGRVIEVKGFSAKIEKSAK